MPRPRVVVVHHERSFFPLDLHEAVWEDVELAWVVTAPPIQHATARLLHRLGPVADITGLDLDAAARAVGQLHPDGIVTFVDDQLVVAAELAARLGLPFHTPEAARAMVDKRRQRAVLERAGVPGPRFWPVPDALPDDALRALASEVVYPAVVKQAFGMGSRNMCLADGPSELCRILRARPGGWLVEELLEDDPRQDPRFASYVSVESVVADGATVHAAVCGRFPLAVPFRETGNIIPALLSAADRDAVIAVADAAIAALQVRAAVVHTEVKLTPRGPALIEVNGRLGGRPPFVLRRVSDVNLFRAACLAAAGRPTGVTGPATCDGVGYWLMLQPPTDAERVVAIDGLQDVARLPGVESVAVRRRPGEPVDWREGTDGNVLVVRGAGRDHDEVGATVERVREAAHIRYARRAVAAA